MRARRTLTRQDSGTLWGCEGVVGVLLRVNGIYEDTIS